MRIATLVFVFCLVCLTQPVWANGSTHHNNNVDADNRNTVNVENHNLNSANAGSYSGSEATVKGDDAAAASAGVYLSGCQQGVGAQGLGFGASTGGESRVCQLLRLAAAHQALGQPFEAMRLVRQATEEMNGGGYTPGEAPVLARASRWFRRNLVAPLFSWLPFVGHSV